MERSEQNLNEFETESLVVFANGMGMWSEGKSEDSQILSLSLVQWSLIRFYIKVKLPLVSVPEIEKTKERRAGVGGEDSILDMRSPLWTC